MSQDIYNNLSYRRHDVYRALQNEMQMPDSAAQWYVCYGTSGDSVPAKQVHEWFVANFPNRGNEMFRKMQTNCVGLLKLDDKSVTIDVTKETMSIANKISEAGLIEVTTDRQRKNGTQMYKDPQTGAFYGLYSKGYVRRVFVEAPKYPWSRPGAMSMYPVNKRKIEKGQTSYGYEYEIKTYVTVPNFSDRIELMLEAVENHRLSHRIDILRKKFPELSNKCLRELAKKNYAYFSK